MFQKPKLKKKKTETVTQKTYYTVYNRDNGTCQLCGNRIGLSLHHIHGRGRHLTNNVNNCIMLCDDFSGNRCHKKVHNNQKKYRPILKEIIERGKNNEGDKI